MPASPLHETAEPDAQDAARLESEQGFECDACGRWFTGDPGGAGLFLWTRGDEVRYEEPPLCRDCASEITVGALLKWNAEDEEEG